MRAAGVPVASVNDFAGVIGDPQIEHREMVAHMDYEGVPVRLIGSPLKFAGADQHYKAPPALGAHGHSILKNDLGMSDAEAAACLSRQTSAKS
jgi:crotonobetainyl-CoA:carnitine CoA-transferase CaiB-like acyl-CoA transferase